VSPPGAKKSRSTSQSLPLPQFLAIMSASALATLAGVIALVLVVGYWMYAGPGPAARQGAATTVILRQGAGLPEIASSLGRAGVVNSGAIFVAAAQITGAARHLKAGEYAFASRASMSSVIDEIRRGDVVHHTVTIPEGLTAEQVVDVLMADDVLSGAAPVPAEGSILPETYEVRRGEDRAEVLQRMMDARDNLLRTLWAQRRGDLPLQTPQQAVILASIVEKETALPDERPRVAAVFINRLQRGVRLGSDPTIIYGLTGGKPLGRGIRESELTTFTPYNTYLIEGLPPGPICNPGRASLAAALDPPHTDELYFVASGTGGHVFASTLEQHQKNVEHWRGVERQAKLAMTAGARR
jgi:UPF0755 protein